MQNLTLAHRWKFCSMAGAPVLDVSITVARLDDATGHHVYACACSFGGSAGPSWTVNRRFKQFSALREGAKLAAATAAKVDFPAKTPLRLRRHPQSLADERAVKLQAFLRQLVVDAMPAAGGAAGRAAALRAAHAAALKHFLGADASKRPDAGRVFDQCFGTGEGGVGAGRTGGDGATSGPPLPQPRQRQPVPAALVLGCAAVAMHWLLRPHFRWLTQVLVLLHCVALLAGL